MPLPKQKKAALDLYTMEFNKWAERVLDGVYKRYPRAQVPIKKLMLFYVSDLFYKDAIDHFCMRYKRKYGE